jgi:hypothetical protein
MNKDSEDFIELDLLCGEQQQIIRQQIDKIKFLEQECSAMREQIAHLESLVYGGRTG